MGRITALTCRCARQRSACMMSAIAHCHGQEVPQADVERRSELVIFLQATRNQAERQGRRLGPLITDVNPQVFSRPTFRLFLALLDNYKRYQA